MAADKESIEEAYQDAVKNLYATLYDNLASGGKNPTPEWNADQEQKFRDGLARARQTRDIALAVLAEK